MEQEMFIKILEKEMVPALGCTDPIGVAYASAYAKKYAVGAVLSIDAELSINIIKNATAVSIPKTGGKCGVSLALGLGAVAGDPDLGLEVLEKITLEDVKEAEKLIERGAIKIALSQNPKRLYMKVTLKTDQAETIVTIEDRYTKITSILVNGETIYLNCKDDSEEASGQLSYNILTLKSILDFTDTVSIEKLGIIQKAIAMNMVIAEEGFTKDFGVSAGKSIKNLVQSGKMGPGMASTAMMWTAAAIDARMAGCDLPVMSNTGSGNQGLASTIPVISIARKMEVPYEKMVRAVTLSSLVTIYIKEKLGALSAVCGAVIAGTATSCGVVYLLDGNIDNMVAALQSTLGDVSGMLCDGAKAGCSLKVATCTNSGVFAALIAMDNKGIKGTDGIVGYGESQTIDNYITIATEGMRNMDHVILEIILNKQDLSG
jgi:L-cysteine desulfidase